MEHCSMSNQVSWGIAELSENAERCQFFGLKESGARLVVKLVHWYLTVFGQAPDEGDFYVKSL